MVSPRFRAYFEYAANCERAPSFQVFAMAGCAIRGFVPSMADEAFALNDWFGFLGSALFFVSGTFQRWRGSTALGYTCWHNGTNAT